VGAAIPYRMLCISRARVGAELAVWPMPTLVARAASVGESAHDRAMVARKAIAKGDVSRGIVTIVTIEIILTAVVRGMSRVKTRLGGASPMRVVRAGGRAADAVAVRSTVPDGPARAWCGT
jgi:hypothetical protein